MATPPSDPLLRAALRLRDQFGLPTDELVTDFIELYLLTEDDSFLQRLSALGGPFLLRSPLGPHLGEMDVLVTGVDGYTTKKQWLDLWPRLRKLLDRSLTAPKGKRPTDPLKRDLIWWQWHKGPLKYKEIADRWQDETGETVAEDTIRAAVNRIEKLMRPVPLTET